MPISLTEIDDLRASLHSGKRPAFAELQTPGEDEALKFSNPESDRKGPIKGFKDRLLRFFRGFLSASRTVKREPECLDANRLLIPGDSWTEYLNNIDHFPTPRQDNFSDEIGEMISMADRLKNQRNSGSSSPSKSPLSEHMTTCSPNK